MNLIEKALKRMLRQISKFPQYKEEDNTSLIQLARNGVFGDTYSPRLLFLYANKYLPGVYKHDYLTTAKDLENLPRVPMVLLFLADEVKALVLDQMEEFESWESLTQEQKYKVLRKTIEYVTDSF